MMELDVNGDTAVVFADELTVSDVLVMQCLAPSSCVRGGHGSTCYEGWHLWTIERMKQDVSLRGTLLRLYVIVRDERGGEHPWDENGKRGVRVVRRDRRDAVLAVTAVTGTAVPV